MVELSAAGRRAEAAAVERIVGSLRHRHAGEQTVYMGCQTVCDAMGQCVLKVHLKDGQVTAIEPDDRYNAGVGREDRLLSERDLAQVRVQRRACPMAWIGHKLGHGEGNERVLYPLKRRPGAKRGAGDFVRISWDEALDTIVAKMIECRDRYGPYSIMTPFLPNSQAERLFGFWGAGVDTWGWCSCDAERLSTHLTTGRLGWENYKSSSGPDVFLNAKLIVLWGFDPTTTHMGPGHQFAWYLRMARERGTPVICLDPRYTMAAEVLADQWIPIKPGTDMAFILAVAHALFVEKLFDDAFVDRFIEPEGFERWRRYALGENDGVAKSPGWAETICGVPAETIVDFARLYARSKPTWLYKNWSVGRKSRGENAARGAAALQAMMGYFGVPGGVMPYFIGAWPVPSGLPLGDEPLDYEVPKICRSHKWAQAVLLADEVRAGTLGRDEWRAMVGYKGDPALPIPEDFRPRMLWWGGWFEQGSNHLVTACDSTNDQIRALESMDFVLCMQTNLTPTARFADMVLPGIERNFEDVRFSTMGSGFSTISCAPGLIRPPGEVRHSEWVFTKIAERLGFGKQFNHYYTDDEHWYDDWAQYQRLSYEAITKELDFAAPEWQEFKAGEFIHLEEHRDEPFAGYTAEIAEGRPFLTRSGKFEMYSPLVADEAQRGAQHHDHLGRLIHSLPNDWRDLPPMPEYQPCHRGFEDPLGSRYPLVMLTSHSRYRIHSKFWSVPWLNGDVYRHAVWIGVADAQRRGISDGDQVRIYNDKGEIQLPAYVTSRLMPGIVLVRQGAWYSPERGITPNVLLGENVSPVTPAPASTLVQVEKLAEVRL